MTTNKFIIFLFLVLFLTNAFGEKNNCGVTDFQRLSNLARQKTISDLEFEETIKIVKNLERSNCSEYVLEKNGKVTIDTGRTKLLGEG
jgi:hypothetical protein